MQSTGDPRGNKSGENDPLAGEDRLGSTLEQEAGVGGSVSAGARAACPPTCVPSNPERAEGAAWNPEPSASPALSQLRPQQPGTPRDAVGRRGCLMAGGRTVSSVSPGEAGLS